MIRVLPGKTNLKKLGYSDLGLTPDDFGNSGPWERADDTEAWIVREEDKKIVGQMDWSLASDLSEKHPCKLDNNDIFLQNIDIRHREQGKGYGTAALDQKHKDWKSKGVDSVTLDPIATGSDKQLELVDWYKRQGYQKSNKCQHKPNCDNDLTCYLTKTLF
tara:strand:+ start:202 stop:684 length:483 start_codon:yes stop_codon:yes gene_type:complete